ncbi:hypothetical protein [Agromyces neolithicus]|uniref:hypothetical protein n=1 Tax=Agromyces neolithicus TaxID=269420 RepID=UPI0031D53212
MSATATSICRGPLVFFEVAVGNHEAFPVGAEITAKATTRSIQAVQPGAEQSRVIATRLSAFEGSNATVTATAEVDGQPVSRTISVCRSARSAASDPCQRGSATSGRAPLAANTPTDDAFCSIHLIFNPQI